MRFAAFPSRPARDLRREAPRFMTFREIIEREDQNVDSIWLYSEGMFMKAVHQDREYGCDFSAHISKNVSNPLGLRLKDLAYKLCYSVRMLYDVADRDAHIDVALEYCSEIKFALQVLKDLKEMSVNTFSLASERIVSVSKQLSALR